jgi:hypothetical protein
MKCSYLTGKLAERSALIRNGIAISNTIGKLTYAKEYNTAWANEVFNTLSSITANLRPYVAEVSKLEALLPEAHKILRKPTVDEYKSCLLAIEKGSFGENMEKYAELKSRLGSLDYNMGLYIPDFQSRWKSAKEAIANEKDRIAKAEAEAERLRLEKEAKEAEAKRIAEQEAAEKARRAAIRNTILATVIPIVIAAATVFASILLNNSISGDWKKWLILTAISIGYATAILTFRIFKGKLANYIHLYVSIPALVTAIVFLFIPSLRLVTLYICAPIFLASISRWLYFFITSEYDDDDENVTLNITAPTAFSAIAISMFALAIQQSEVENASMIVLMCGMALVTIVNFMHIRVYGESVGLLSLIATIGSAVVFFMPFFTHITSTAVYVLGFVVPGLTFFANVGIFINALSDGDF